MSNLNISQNRDIVNLPVFIMAAEAASLFSLMLDGKSDRENYFDPRHKELSEIIKHISDQLGYCDVETLLDYLHKSEPWSLEKCGSEAYIYKIFGNFKSELRDILDIMYE